MSGTDIDDDDNINMASDKTEDKDFWNVTVLPVPMKENIVWFLEEEDHL